MYIKLDTIQYLISAWSKDLRVVYNAVTASIHLQK